jgi:ABC-type antimicrobial peptide transport system permease subunit
MDALHELAVQLQGRAELTEIVPFTTVVNRTLVAERVIAHVLSVLGVLTLLIVAIGLYSLIAFDVARRAPEIAIRVALGATRTMVAWIVGKRALAVLGTGVLLGGLLFLYGSRQVSNMVFEVSPWDPPSIAIGILSLACVAMAASFFAVLKALRLSPSRVLQSE